jgi:hypothetical protein
VTGAGDETLRFWDLGYQQEEQGTWKNTNSTKLSGLFSYNNSKKGKKNKKGSKLEIPVLR